MSKLASAGRTLGRRCLAFAADDRGATAIEYAMIAVGIAVAVSAMVFKIGNSLNVNFYSKVNEAVAAPL